MVSNECSISRRKYGLFFLFATQWWTWKSCFVSDSFSIFRNDYICPANHFLGHFFFGNPVSEDIKTKVDVIKKQYFGNGNDVSNEDVFKNLTNAFTDSGFFYGSDQMAR